MHDDEVPVAWLQAGATRRPGGLPPEPTFSLDSSSDDDELAPMVVRLFAAVRLRRLEEIVGASDDSPSPRRVEPADLAGHVRIV